MQSIFPGAQGCYRWPIGIAGCRSNGCGATAALLLVLLGAACGGSSAPTSPSNPPATDPPVQQPPILPDEVFVGAGDIGWCASSAPEATARLLDGIPGTVFTTGDNAYMDGSLRNFAECYEPNWGRHKNRTYPSPGNHEYQTSGAAGYFQYYGSRAGPPGLGYYSFNLGNWHIVSLNSNVPSATGSAQLTWLRSDLESNRRLCTAAYWHHPLFSSGPHPDGSMKDTWRVLYEFNVDVVLNGHDHLYERFAPQDPDGNSDAARGIRQFTVGSGGAPLYGLAVRRPNSEAFISAHGVLKLTLRASDYQWQFIPTSGSGSGGDSGTDRCR